MVRGERRTPERHDASFASQVAQFARSPQGRRLADQAVRAAARPEDPPPDRAGPRQARPARQAPPPRLAQRDAQQLLELRDRLSASVWCTVAMPSASRRLEVAGRGRRRRRTPRAQADALGAERVDRRVGLAHARPRPRSPSRRRARRSGRGRRRAPSPHEFEIRPVRMPARLGRARPRRASPRRRSARPNSRVDEPVVALGERRAPRRTARSNSACVELPELELEAAAARGSGSLRNASRTRVGLRGPRRSQNAAKLSKTFVVRTPPKSTSSPCAQPRQARAPRRARRARARRRRTT